MKGPVLRWCVASWSCLGAAIAFAIVGWVAVGIGHVNPRAQWWPSWAIGMAGFTVSLPAAGVCMFLAFRSIVLTARTPAYPPYVGKARWKEVAPGEWQAEYAPPVAVPAGMALQSNLPLPPVFGGPIGWFPVYAEYRPVTAADREERPYGRCGE